MKRKNLILPFLALAFAVGMAFATTPVWKFDTEVWMKEHSLSPCTPTICVLNGDDECQTNVLLYSDENCSNQIEEAFIRQN
jgi:hypothetical protein